MSQEQPRRPQQDEDPITYGDIFNVSGDLASEPIAPEDANLMQSAETKVFGQTQRGGAAAAMQSAATLNERAGVVGHRDATEATAQGVTVTETQVPGARIITEKVAGQIVGQSVQPSPGVAGLTARTMQNVITVGEALEAAAYTAGNKPVDQSDAAAIQAAEVRATGSNVIIPGGLAATAQSAAACNATKDRDEDKVKLTDILTGASANLAADKAVTRADAEGIASAELRNNPNLSTYSGGVAQTMIAAARLNENDM